MAKKKKKKNIGNYFIKKFSDTKWLIAVIVTIIALVGGIFGVRYVFFNNSFFTVKEVQLNGNTGKYLKGAERKIRKRYVGKNIFTVNLQKVQAYAVDTFPQIKKVEARKSMPDILEVDITPREPVAILDTGRGFIVDTEGIVLAVGKAEEYMVKITGIRFFLNAPSVGEKIKKPVLVRALILIKGLSSNIRKNAKNIEYIDVSDKKNILLGIDGVVVKMGKDDFSRKVDKLKEILEDPNMSLKEINYIDLRFEDAVISPR